MAETAGWAGAFARVRDAVPRGRTLPARNWKTRHKGILVLLAAHAAVLPVFGLVMGVPASHALLEGGLIGALAIIASWSKLPQRARSVIGAFGLMSCSGILTHLSGGYIEAHFHFFVMLGVILLYEDWLPFLLSIAYVAIHHGITGTIDPRSVYNHPAAIAHPWYWAGIHAFFILGLSAALIVTWHVSETARRSEAVARGEARGLRRQLAAQEKMAALGSLSSGIAHEVRTPLTIVATNASLIESQIRRMNGGGSRESAAAIEQSLAEIQSSVERMNRLVLQLRRFTKLADDDRRIAPIQDVVEEAVRLFIAAHGQGVRIEMELSPTPAVEHHPLGVQQVVLNLLANAAEAIEPNKGRVRVETGESNGRATIAVEDDGCGMDDDVRKRIFEPLFTTKPEGTGLGLSIVKKIASQHGGVVEFDTAPRRGTRFVVSFPAPAPAPAASAPSAHASPS